MNSEIQILSTKKLTPKQELSFAKAKIGQTSYDAIHIQFLSIQFSENIPNGIITSQNGARAVVTQQIQFKNVFCVGNKTKALLVKNGYNVIETAKNASELAQIIIKTYKNEPFLFCCGNLRRGELPALLQEYHVRFSEKMVYQTILNIQKINNSYDGILFFSPSGVQSFVKENAIGNAVAFCIGKTTAKEAQKYTKNVVITAQTTIENVITTAIDYFRP